GRRWEGTGTAWWRGVQASAGWGAERFWRRRPAPPNAGDGLFDAGEVVHRAPGPKHLAIVLARKADGPPVAPHGAWHELGHVGHLGQRELHLQADRRRQPEWLMAPAERRRDAGAY